MKATESALFLHTQEARGSSPCVPTIGFNQATVFLTTDLERLVFEQDLCRHLHRQIRDCRAFVNIGADRLNDR
jgi:hypothetical protein